MALSIDDIAELFARRGSEQYSGEPVTQLEHALQTAHLAEQSDADDALVTACLLHDLGHLLNQQGETPTLRGIDDTHQYYALPFLRGLLPDAVLDPIKLHVDAKRYLCATDASYHARLSDDSKRSLALQGGPFEAAQAAVFLDQPGARDAVLLRQWDDLAKQPRVSTPPLAHFLQRASRCLLTHAADA
jgi:phosphonate degradation associated HDIG domain protein